MCVCVCVCASGVDCGVCVCVGVCGVCACVSVCEWVLVWLGWASGASRLSSRVGRHVLGRLVRGRLAVHLLEGGHGRTGHLEGGHGLGTGWQAGTGSVGVWLGWEGAPSEPRRPARPRRTRRRSVDGRTRARELNATMAGAGWVGLGVGWPCARGVEGGRWIECGRVVEGGQGWWARR